MLPHCNKSQCPHWQWLPHQTAQVPSSPAVLEALQRGAPLGAKPGDSFQVGEKSWASLDGTGWRKCSWLPQAHHAVTPHTPAPHAPSPGALKTLWPEPAPRLRVPQVPIQVPTAPRARHSSLGSCTTLVALPVPGDRRATGHPGPQATRSPLPRVSIMPLRGRGAAGRLSQDPCHAWTLWGERGVLSGCTLFCKGKRRGLRDQPSPPQAAPATFTEPRTRPGVPIGMASCGLWGQELGGPPTFHSPQG